MLIAFNKPYGVISQFTPDGSPNRTLAEFGFPKGVYSIGRLDADSEGLLLLSDETALNEKLLHPRLAIGKPLSEHEVGAILLEISSKLRGVRQQ